LPIAYSKGFNPHQIVSFALPLPLGMGSVNDYADVTLTTDVPTDEIIEKLNACAPRGLLISGAYATKGQPAAAATVAADYRLELEVSAELLQVTIQRILIAETLIIPKKTKSGVKDTDIRPDILGIELWCNKVDLRLSAGSARFLNPLLVADLLIKYALQATEYTPQQACTSFLTRLELYQSDGQGGFTPL